MRNSCMCLLKIGDLEVFCALSDGHEGECLPKRSDLLNAAERFEHRAQEIFDEIDRRDGIGFSWPYEGPEEAAA